MQIRMMFSLEIFTPYQAKYIDIFSLVSAWNLQ